MTEQELANVIWDIKEVIRNSYDDSEVEDVILPFTLLRRLDCVLEDKYDDILEEFFTSHPLIHHCITFNSKAHLVGEFLLRSNRRNVQIMGYDMVPKNAECVRQGSISFLIAQHGFMQGYTCVDALFRAIVLKKKVEPINYMPIELLTKENIDFYRRNNIG